MTDRDMADLDMPARRDLLRNGLIAAALGLGKFPLTAFGFPAAAEGETPLAFLDPQPASPDRPMLRWADLDSWITPDDQFFTVQHYGVPEANPAEWSLEVSGLVRNAASFSLDQIRSRPKSEMTATLECAGNGVSPGFMGAIANSRWAGAPLAPLLEEAGVASGAIEAVFFGADEKVEEIRKKEYLQNFARSLSLDDIRKLNVMLIYERNGKPLEKAHGGPLRLGVPGHYGVAWVKWLKRIELLDHRFAGKFMARDYVTIRGEKRGEKMIWRETTVSTVRVKSIVARAVKLAGGGVRVFGAAWDDGSAPLASVEVRIDGGPWRPARLGEGSDNPYAWTFWDYDWRDAEPGEHTLVSRAVGQNGVVQPAADDPRIKYKRTYWEANQQVPRRVKI